MQKRKNYHKCNKCNLNKQCSCVSKNKSYHSAASYRSKDAQSDLINTKKLIKVNSTVYNNCQ